MARVASVARDGGHRFSKQPAVKITLIEGEGVVGDAHRGVTVKHRSRVRRDPTQPNLRQVHLLSVELLAEMAAHGFTVTPGDLGENVVTEGIDLHALPRGTRLAFAGGPVLELTGLRNPCAQIDDWKPGLLAAVLRKGDDGTLVRRAGVMSVVLAGGDIASGDAIRIDLPDEHHPMETV